MQMSKLQPFDDQSEYASSNDFNNQDQNNSPSLSQRVLCYYTIFKAWIKINKPKIYLMLILLSIFESFYADNYYKTALICKYTNDRDCMQYGLNPQAKKVQTYIIMLFTDCFIFLFYIYAFIYKKTYRLLTAFGIAQQIYLFYSGPFEMSVFNMMGIIKIVHFPLLILSVGIVLITVSVRYCCRKSAKYTLGGIFVFFLLFYGLIIRNQCYYWKMGINGEIQNKEGSCKMEAPLCSYLQIISHLDLDFFIHNCFLGDKYKQIFNEHFQYDIDNGTIVGFADLKNASEIQRSHGHIAKTVFQSAKRYKTFQQARKTMKHDVIFDTANQQYFIQVIHNQTLEEEKKQIYSKFQESSSPPLVKNVLLIFLDSVSRFETHIKLPKFVKWFEKQAKYKSYSLDEPQKSNISPSKPQAYEFYKYHSLQYYSQGNIYPMYYGDFISNMMTKAIANATMPRYNSFHKEFSERGFVTSFSSSFCASYGADIYDGHTKGAVNPVADHQTFSFNCDPNFHQPYFQFGFTKGNSAATDRCLYHQTQAQYAFQYTTSFFDKYKNSSKFSHINLIEGHEYFGGSVRFLDNSITTFLQEMQAKGHLDDTLVIALSDHGQHQGNSFKSIYSDHYHPFLYMAVPTKMNSKYRDSIRLNQQNLITAFNFYHFMMHVAIGDSYQNKELGLMGDLSFQTNCKAAKISSKEQQTCNCK